jgi:hypothetical protein
LRSSWNRTLQIYVFALQVGPRSISEMFWNLSFLTKSPSMTKVDKRTTSLNTLALFSWQTERCRNGDQRTNYWSSTSCRLRSTGCK